MSKIRVLIVDDSVVVRKLVTDVLASDPGLEVAGTAANGRIGLSKISIVNPDVVTLDVEMPELDGLQTLAAIRKQYPTLPVIMFSSQTQRGAATTIDALTLGANDYVTKPANVGCAAVAMQSLRDQLVPKIKFWCGRLTESASLPQRPRSRFAHLEPPRNGAAVPSLVDIVAIGVSTGGPNALSTLLPQLPGDLPVPIVIVQHMPPVFTRLLAERLASRSALKVSEAAPGQEILPGHVYVAPGDFHMIVKRDGVSLRAQTNQDPPENSCRPAVDVLFRSVANLYGSRTLSIILTGMGQDGLRGCERIREAGGQILAQDKASSVVWGMPGFVTKAGLADEVLPLKEIAGEIVRRVCKGRADNQGRRGA
jgi:two-component system, chemotaxis family, protein-glutamate methylesterase/glutaminase